MRASQQTHGGPLALVAWLAVSVAVHEVVAAAAVWGSGSHPAAEPDPALAVHRAEAQVGETFEVPVEEVDHGGGAPADQSEQIELPATAPAEDGRARASRPTRRVASTAAAEGGGAGSATFGAVGERSAVDVATAFTRGFPQAASADVAWASAPFGAAGSADVYLTLDETGALVSSRSTGAASAALAAGVRRTLALIRARSFVASRRETHLRVTATVSPDQVHDGLHGEVFAIGGTFERGEGSGFFALSVGRRIDVRVREVR